MFEVLTVVFAVIAAVAASLGASRLCAVPRRCPLVIDGGFADGSV